MRRLGVGVVGCGGIAQMMHLPTLHERPDLFEIVGLADVSRRTLDAVARRYPAPLVTTDPRALLRDARVEAVLLLNSGGHDRAAIEALAAGRHVFAEKPLSCSVAETERVARAVRPGGPVLMVGYHKRYDPAYRAAAEEVRGMSALRFVEATVLHPDDGAYRAHHAILPPRPFRASPEEATFRESAAQATTGDLRGAIDETIGRGAPVAHRVATSMLFQSLIHDINALRGILGEPEQVLTARTWLGGMAQTSLTRFPGDVHVALSWVYVGGLKHYDERLLFVGPGRRVELRFPSPYLRHAPTPLTVERAGRQGRLITEQHTVSYEEAFSLELLHFRECVLRGRAPHTGLPDALGDARWIRAIARAFAKGPQPVAAPRRPAAARRASSRRPPRTSPAPAPGRARPPAGSRG